jgi:hypothetical protein
MADGYILCLSPIFVSFADVPVGNQQCGQKGPQIF